MTIEKYKSSQFSQRFIRVILDIIIGWSVIWKSYRYFLVFKEPELKFHEFLTISGLITG